MNQDNPDRILNEHMARLEERMNTMKATYEGALDRNNAAFERMRADMATYREDAVKRDKDNLRWVVGLFIAAIVIIPILSNSVAIANLVTLLGS